MTTTKRKKLSAAQVIDRFGVNAISLRVGVSRSSVKEARRAGSFPANWFQIVEEMCASDGSEVARDAFNWRAPSGTAQAEAS